MATSTALALLYNPTGTPKRARVPRVGEQMQLCKSQTKEDSLSKTR
ncbi:hypothetical protein [Microcoleus sp. FACHB-672]|nr:hypothetical protein [Microcoleus sp. FACHB-672]MBD2040483.1 hypothetical protein [Microcoleus sp. FACHB-672]